MDSILPHIVDLKKKVLFLTSKYADVKKDKMSLESEKESLVKKIHDLEKEIEELRKRVEVVDLVKGIGMENRNSMDLAKTRVNNLIREIDKCMSLLNE